MHFDAAVVVAGDLAQAVDAGLWQQERYLADAAIVQGGDTGDTVSPGATRAPSDPEPAR